MSTVMASMSALTLGILALWRLCAWIPRGARYGVVSKSGNPRMLARIVGLAIILVGGCVTALRRATRLQLNSTELAVLSGAGMAISLVGSYFLLLDLRAGAQAARYGFRGAPLERWQIILWLCFGAACGGFVGLCPAWRSGG